MSDRLAAVAYRLLAPRATGGALPASGDDLANEVTSPLPNHALCWAADTLLQLDKSDSTSTALLLSSGEPVIVVPNSGPGRWKAVSGAAMGGASQEAVATTGGTIAVPSAGEWSVMPAASVWSGNSARWFLPTVGQAIMTYTGPPARFRFQANLSVINEAANLTQTRLAVSLNGANIGTTTDLDEVVIQAIANTAIQQVIVEDIIDLIQGNTIQPIFTSDNGDDFTLVKGIFTASFVGLL